MTGVIRCCSYSADNSIVKGNEPSTQVAKRELIGSKTSPIEEEEFDETYDTTIDSVESENASEQESIEPAVFEAVKRRDPNKPIRLQVLNGCGERGIARRVAPSLRRLGFDVRESRNAKNFKHQTSKIYDRSGDMNLAYQVANAVGIDSALVDKLPDEELVDIDVTIVIGADYQALNLGMNE